MSLGSPEDPDGHTPEKLQSNEVILYTENDFIILKGFTSLPEDQRNQILSELASKNLNGTFEITNDGVLKIGKPAKEANINLTEIIGRIIHYKNHRKTKVSNAPIRSFPVELDAKAILGRSKHFADALDQKRQRIIEVLMKYETYEAANDEMQRTTDLLRNLSENSEYFVRQVGSIASFLPSNQPLYAFACFAVVPSLMAKEVHAKIPRGMNHFFPELLKAIDVKNHFPNIHVNDGPREDFVKKHSATSFRGRTKEFETAVDAVIFTGNSSNALNMRRSFHNRVLMIVNGSGHNPLVVTDAADVHGAVHSSLRVQLYNQGQDCAAPNSILVHSKVYGDYIEKLVAAVKETKVGAYADRRNRVGPISKKGDLPRIQEIIEDNANFLNAATEGVIRIGSGIVEPTIIEKPLSEGGNLRETFAPIFFVQRYEEDGELEKYFKHPQYRNNAMYITVYGYSPYIEGLIGNPDDPHVLHDESTIIRNTDLHAPGIERGVKPYGGYGRGASNISIGGKIVAKPTLPQRDIYEQLVEPSLRQKS